jgi:multiple sugar transport system ATP-binding protein
VRKPKVFLFDEPLSNLDAKLRVQTRAEIQQLHHRLETTFIYVTHDQTEAMTMATRIAVMKDGILQQVDSPQSLYDLPVNVFVAGFIGSPAMNFFNAKLVRGDGGMQIDTGSFKVSVPSDKAKVYEDHIDKDVIFGIRPEDIHDTQFTPPGIQPADVHADVQVVEPMGNELILYLKAAGDTFVSRMDPRSQATVNESKKVVFNMDNIHLFETTGDQLAIR